MLIGIIIVFGTYIIISGFFLTKIFYLFQNSTFFRDLVYAILTSIDYFLKIIAIPILDTLKFIVEFIKNHEEFILSFLDDGETILSKIFGIIEKIVNIGGSIVGEAGSLIGDAASGIKKVFGSIF